jgi:N-acetylglucosamine kinase
MNTWMGIDGGGSSLRVVIVDDYLNILERATGESANPSGIGRDAAATRIQNTVQDALKIAQLTQVSGVGIGIAGASYVYASEWLVSVLQPVLPNVPVVPSSDVEIALIGGRGQENGVLILSGTGSVAVGIHPDGRRRRVGGWGYLLGDEGSGYWIGTQALQILTRWADGYENNQLATALMDTLHLQTPLEVIRWRYQQASVADVAALAPLVMELEASIVQMAAQHLASMTQHLLYLLDLTPEVVVFGGSLLTNDTLLNRLLKAELHLTHDPMPRYEPAVGAALLARLRTL